MGRYRPYVSCDFTRSNCLIYIKSEKYGKEIGEKLKLSHKVSINTASASETGVRRYKNNRNKKPDD